MLSSAVTCMYYRSEPAFRGSGFKDTYSSDGDGDDAGREDGRADHGDHQRRGKRRVAVRQVAQSAHDQDQEQHDEQGERGHGVFSLSGQECRADTRAGRIFSGARPLCLGERRRQQRSAPRVEPGGRSGMRGQHDGRGGG